ncbi:hypothetical protein DM01DRAFT_1339931 [Hesseltinella vesiculosa]|uniref:Uncharacterized protein n=1 Tax=Hesseltinella vesiculosa TaxID=101127 RepID=A0A1X2G5P9_9FUNG|nr:hypothetical protein DM01DRAFT_1339931 [Hesseltinella vesiculosa]
METLVDYSNNPLAALCQMTWEAPSAWGEATLDALDALESGESSPGQPLTAENMRRHDSTQGVGNGKQDIMVRYQSARKNSIGTQEHSGACFPQASLDTDRPTEARAIPVNIHAKTTAIDAHPLPFPYHNDCTFLPTVETGRTRYDSASTQSLYEEIQSSSTAASAYSTSIHQQHSRGVTPQRLYSRLHPRAYPSAKRCDSNASHLTQPLPKCPKNLRSTSPRQQLCKLVVNNKRRLSLMLSSKRDSKVSLTPPLNKRSSQHLASANISAQTLYEYRQTNSTSRDSVSQYTCHATSVPPSPYRTNSVHTTLYPFDRQQSRSPPLRNLVEPNLFSRFFRKVWSF